MNNIKISLASNKKISVYKRYVDRILFELDCCDSIVTDLSSVSDFISHFTPKRKKEILKLLSNLFDFHVNEQMLICDIAKKIRNKELQYSGL